MRRRVQGAGDGRTAVEPHPVGGRAAGRPGDDHSRRAHSRVRDVGESPAPARRPVRCLARGALPGRVHVSTAGWALLLRHAGRRDRWLITVWVAVLTVLAYASAVATPALFTSLQQQVAAATLINSQPALVALYGPILDTTSTGELAMSKMTVLYAVFAAVL